MGKITEGAAKLISVTEQAYFAGMNAFQEGAHLASISAAVQKTAESAGFSVVRNWWATVSAGCMKSPMCPTSSRVAGTQLRLGLVLAIERWSTMAGKKHSPKRTDGQWSRETEASRRITRTRLR